MIEKVRPPRFLAIDFPLGLTFGDAFDGPGHRHVLDQLIQVAIDGGPEEEVSYNPL